MPKKIGILTWHYYSNFGSALQAFALQQSIKKLGFKSKFVNYRNPKFGRISNVKRIARYALGKILGQKFAYPYILFQMDFLRQTKLVQNKEQAQKLYFQVTIQ